MTRLDELPAHQASQSGYRLNFNGACCGTGAFLTNPGLGAGRSSREASMRGIDAGIRPV